MVGFFDPGHQPKKKYERSRRGRRERRHQNYGKPKSGMATLNNRISTLIWHPK
jgi:hypothetical protein